MSDRFTVHPVPTEPTECGSYYQSIGGICADINFYTTFLVLSGILIVGLTILTRIILTFRNGKAGSKISIVKIGFTFLGIFLLLFFIVVLFLNGINIFNHYFGI